MKDHRIAIHELTIRGIKYSLEEIGRGSSMIVYKATSDNKVIIIKEYYPVKYQNNLCREGQYLEASDDYWEFMKANFIDCFSSIQKAIYQSGNIINMLSQVTHEPVFANNTYYVLQDYHHGISFHDYKVQDLTSFLSLFLQLCHIVDSFHQHQLLILDLKPENCFVLHNYAQTIHLIDFDSFVHISQVHQLTSVKSSKDYCAPELFSDSLNSELITEQCDIYSLGIILKNKLQDVDTSHVHPKAVTLLHQIVQNASNVHPEQRYKHVSEIMKELHLVIKILARPTYLVHHLPNVQIPELHSSTCAKINRELKQNHFVCISALCGSGKKECAYQYAKMYQKDYDAIQSIKWKGTVYHTLKSLSYSNLDEAKSFDSIQDIISVFALLKANPFSTLLIITDFNGSEEEFQLLQSLSDSEMHLLITSEKDFTKSISLPLLKEEDAKTLFLSVYQKQLKAKDEKDFQRILEASKGHPLTLVLFAQDAKRRNSSFLQSSLSQTWKSFELKDESNHLDRLIQQFSFTENQTDLLYALYLCSKDGIDEMVLNQFFSFDNDFYYECEQLNLIERSYGHVYLNPALTSFVHRLFMRDYKLTDELIQWMLKEKLSTVCLNVLERLSDFSNFMLDYGIDLLSCAFNAYDSQKFIEQAERCKSLPYFNPKQIREINELLFKKYEEVKQIKNAYHLLEENVHETVRSCPVRFHDAGDLLASANDAYGQAQFSLAIRRWLTAIQYFQQIPYYQSTVIECLLSISLSYMALNDSEHAELHLNVAEKYIHQNKHLTSKWLKTSLTLAFMTNNQTSVDSLMRQADDYFQNEQNSKRKHIHWILEVAGHAGRFKNYRNFSIDLALQAIGWLIEADEIKSSMGPNAYMILAKAYLQVGKNEEAIQNFNKSINLLRTGGFESVNIHEQLFLNHLLLFQCYFNIAFKEESDAVKNHKKKLAFNHLNQAKLHQASISKNEANYHSYFYKCAAEYFLSIPGGYETSLKYLVEWKQQYGNMQGSLRRDIDMLCCSVFIQNSHMKRYLSLISDMNSSLSVQNKIDQYTAAIGCLRQALDDPVFLFLLPVQYRNQMELTYKASVNEVHMLQNSQG